jgi:hypothetical protein
MTFQLDTSGGGFESLYREFQRRGSLMEEDIDA